MSEKKFPRESMDSEKLVLLGGLIHQMEQDLKSTELTVEELSKTLNPDDSALRGLNEQIKKMKEILSGARARYQKNLQ